MTSLLLKPALGGPFHHIVLGMGGAVPPNEKIQAVCIGIRGRGMHDLRWMIGNKDVHILAICDLQKKQRLSVKGYIDKHYGNKDCTTTRFHEEVLGRDDIDAVLIATGDRWHTVLSALAARAGKDVYCEKPFSLSIAEGRSLVEITERYGTVWKCGTQRRSNDAYRFVVHVVRTGMIGKLHTITAFLGGWDGNGIAKPEPEPDPDMFDYDRWLGQNRGAKKLPVSPKQRHKLLIEQRIRDYQQLCDAVYEQKGFTPDGKPKRETVARFGLMDKQAKRLLDEMGA